MDKMLKKWTTRLKEKMLKKWTTRLMDKMLKATKCLVDKLPKAAKMPNRQNDDGQKD